MASLLALSAAFCWGLADFLGGIQARKVPALIVALGGQLTGASLLAVVVLGRGIGPPDLELIILALGVGVITAVAFFALYTALAVGNMATVAPILGTASFIPLLFGLASGDRLSALQGLGVAAAIGGVVLLSMPGGDQGATVSSDRKARKGMGWALIAATCMGISLVGIKHVSDYDPYWTILLVRTSGVLVLAATSIVTIAKWPRVEEVPYAPILAIGAFDVAANVLFALASTLGALSLVAVLGTMFPAVTVILAVLFLHERLRTHQIAGVLLVLTGSGFVSSG